MKLVVVACKNSTKHGHILPELLAHITKSKVIREVTEQDMAEYEKHGHVPLNSDAGEVPDPNQVPDKKTIDVDDLADTVISMGLTFIDSVIGLVQSGSELLEAKTRLISAQQQTVDLQNEKLKKDFLK